MTHSVYRALWVLSCLTLIFSGQLHGIFDLIIPKEMDDGYRTAMVNIPFFFALVTLLAHQLFIYNSLFDMEKQPQKWENDFSGWYNTKAEKVFRWLAFIMLLAGMDKVIGFDKLCDFIFCYQINYSIVQKMILLASCFFFFTLTWWNILAGLFSNNWRFDFLLSDLFAFVFWIVILLIVTEAVGSVWIIGLILVLISYILIIGARIFKPSLFISNNSQNNANKTN